ncbi:MAG TPA: hypothetical protein VF696_01340 [Candidatus Paceibacterota bacterium]
MKALPLLFVLTFPGIVAAHDGGDHSVFLGLSPSQLEVGLIAVGILIALVVVFINRR